MVDGLVILEVPVWFRDSRAQGEGLWSANAVSQYEAMRRPYERPRAGSTGPLVCCLSSSSASSVSSYPPKY